MDIVTVVAQFKEEWSHVCTQDGRGLHWQVAVVTAVSTSKPQARTKSRLHVVLTVEYHKLSIHIKSLLHLKQRSPERRTFLVP